MEWDGTEQDGVGHNVHLQHLLVNMSLEPLTWKWSCKLLILTSMLHLSVFAMFVLSLNCHTGMLINPVLGNRGAGSAVLTVANLCVHRFVSLCRAAVCLVINIRR